MTLRVTPQISEGDTLRLQIFQEITEVAATSEADSRREVGVTLQSRKVENTVVVNDGETVVIGGLISEVYADNVTSVPWLRRHPDPRLALQDQERGRCARSTCSSS